MACNTREISRRLPVYSDGDDSTVVFRPIVTLPVLDVEAFRVRYRMDGDSGEAEVAVAWRYTQDRLTWETLNTGTFSSPSDLWVFTDYETADVLYTWVQIGIAALNAAGTAMEQATVEAIVEYHGS